MSVCWSNILPPSYEEVMSRIWKRGMICSQSLCIHPHKTMLFPPSLPHLPDGLIVEPLRLSPEPHLQFSQEILAGIKSHPRSAFFLVGNKKKRQASYHEISLRFALQVHAFNLISQRTPVLSMPTHIQTGPSFPPISLLAANLHVTGASKI